MSQLNRLIGLYQSGRFGEAVDCGEALRVSDCSAAGLYYLGAAYLQLRQFEQARTCFTQVLGIEPANAYALIGMGSVLRRLGRPDEARDFLERAVKARPNDAFTQLNLGAVLEETGKLEEARLCFARAIQIDPAFAEAYFYLGAVLAKLGDRSAAAAALRRAIALKPNYPEAHNTLANIQQELGAIEQAIESYRAALQLNPNFSEAHYGLGVALKYLGRREESIASLTRALDLDPAHELARAQRLYQQAHLCDWDAMAEDYAQLSTLGVRQPVSPFALLALDGDPGRQYARAQRYAETFHRQALAQSFAAPSSRIRIGYFSADFRNHAMMHVMARMFELHDRARFELHAFAFGPDTSDAMRMRTMAAFDHFHAVHDLSDQAVAVRARALGIDIAIDLMGYTNGSRTAIFAYRAAPIQVGYLGYPGTMGAPFMEYLIADRFLIPPEERQYYSERIITMPQSYQVSDNTRSIAPAPPRSQLDLPDSGFVFCCFNNTHKIGVAEFDIWMRLLHAVSGSVLWLVGTNRLAEENLRRQARKRDVDPSRLIFAPRVPPSEHLARQQAADLFLDTFIYNAHGTANDALWAGLPLLTKMGRAFPARVGASVLAAAGLAELIADDEAAYERLALELATQPERLAAIKQRLLANRVSAPLFNSAAFTRHIEAAFAAIHARRIAGTPAADLTVAG